MRYWAVVTRGLEPLGLAEIRSEVPGLAAAESSYRRVAFAAEASPASLLGLRTLDDLFIDLGTWSGIGRPRAALHVLAEHAGALDLRDAAALCRDIRTLGRPPSFSITANFVGRRNYSTDEIKQAIAESIEAAHGWPYHARDEEADLNIRVFLEHEVAYVGLRLAATPLHERRYKVANIAGSLKPTVAAAMVRLGRFDPGAAIVDPLCGAGTIVIEAAAMGYHAAGGDLDVEALAAARANGETIGSSITFEQWDARALPLPDASVDGIVCNLPWGRQVVIDAEIRDFYVTCVGEMARVVRPGGRLVLLTSLRELLREVAEGAELSPDSETEISLSGQTPAISILERRRVG